MGKITGFMEFQRAERPYEPVETRVVFNRGNEETIGICIMDLPPATEAAPK